MPRVELRPSTQEDFQAYTSALYGRPALPPTRVRAITGWLDGKIIGIGGIAFWPDGTRMAFADLMQEAHEHPIALHKAGLRVITMARECGIKVLTATAWEGHPAAERWLLRLGFKPLARDGLKIYVLEPLDR